MAHELDATGLTCPLPVLKAKRALKAVPDGETLTVFATDPSSVDDFRAFCATTGHELLSVANDGGRFVYVIRKKGLV